MSRVGRNDCLRDVGRGSLADVELLGKVHSSVSRRLGTVAVVHHGRLLCDVGVVWWLGVLAATLLFGLFGCKVFLIP